MLCAGVHSGFTSEQVVAYVWNGDSISNVELQQLLGLNSIEVGRLLHQMVEKELLDRSSKNRWTTYTVRKEKSKEKSNIELSPREMQVLELIRKDSRYTYKAISQLIGCSEAYVYKLFNKLKKKGVVKRGGGRKDGFWVIKE